MYNIILWQSSFFAFQCVAVSQLEITLHAHLWTEMENKGSFPASFFL